MTKKGIALAVVLSVVAILSVIIISLFSQVIHERNLVNRHVNTARAFWLAEAGISESFVNLTPTSGTLSQNQGCPGGAICSYQTSITDISDAASDGKYYRIDSVGEVILAQGAQLESKLSVIVKTDPPGSDNFPHAIETTGSLVIRGQAYEIEGTISEGATLNFSDLFGVTKAEMEEKAINLYNESDFDEPINEVTWVNVSSGQELNIAGSIEGEGILVVSGDCHISGTINFEGIVYIIGGLRISGNPTLDGTVLAESGTDIDTTISGNVTINYDLDLIEAALAILPDALDRPVYSSKEIAVWQQK